MLRFLFAFLLAAPLAFGQVEIEPFIDASGVRVTPGTAGVIPAWNGVPDDLIDTTLSYDGTNITLASGQLLLPDGSVSAPSIAFTSTTNTGFRTAAVGTLTIVVAGSGRWDFSGSAFESTTTSGPRIKRAAGTAGAPTYSFSGDTDGGLYSIGANNIGMAAGGALVMDWEDTNAAGAGTDLATISSVLGIMDGGDTFRGFHIDVENVDHTGGANSNTLIGLDIDAIVGDADALEAGARFGTGWDYDLQFTTSGELFSPTFTSTGTVPDIDHGITQHWLMNPILTANDNANDQRNVLLIDIDMPNGSGGLVNGINIDAVSDDLDTIDSAIMIEGGWDSAITIFKMGHAFTSNPLTGSVFVTLDDSTDYSGGGGNDCWFVLRDAGGNNFGIVQVVLDGACP